MKFPLTLALCAAVTSVLALGVPSQASAQDAKTAIVSIYRVAPGKHLAFLKWMAARESTAREAGAPATQWYRHLDGDSWDYIAIAPPHDDAIDNKADALEKKQGLATGMRAGLELRELMASHTDTIVAGPSSAAELVQAASAP
jgi:hypothetical protein